MSYALVSSPVPSYPCAFPTAILRQPGHAYHDTTFGATDIFVRNRPRAKPPSPCGAGSVSTQKRPARLLFVSPAATAQLPLRALFALVEKSQSPPYLEQTAIPPVVAVLSWQPFHAVAAVPPPPPVLHGLEI